jgi:hypothetical protein
MMENRQPLQPNVAGKSGFLPAENHAYHSVLVSAQGGLRTLMSDMKLKSYRKEQGIHWEQ